MGLSLGDLTYVDDLADVGAAYRFAPPAQMRPSPYGMMPFPPRPPTPPGFGGTVMPLQHFIPSIPGAPKVGLRLQPMGIGTSIFNSTSGTSLSNTNRPQRPFKPKRLVVGIARTGTTSTGLVTVTALNIGTNNQFVATGPINADAFAPNAYDTNLDLAPCTTALDITVNWGISAAPTTTDTVVVNATLIGGSIG